MGGPRTAEPSRPQQGMAADGGSVETLTRHNAGTDGARPKHSALARRGYSLLAPAGTEVAPADVGNPGSEAGHGSTGDQDGREPEEEGDETRQRALPVRGNYGIGDEARGPPLGGRTG